MNVLAIDLGATNLRVGIVNDKFEIINVFREPSVKNDKISLYAQIKRLIEKLDIKKYGITSVGVSACGLISNNHIDYMPNLNISNFPLGELLFKDFAFTKIAVINDANATALEEAIYGASKNVNSSFFITISSGIGGAYINNKTLIDLPYEIGHCFVSYRDEMYESETLLSGNGLVRLSRLNSLKIDSTAEFFHLVDLKNSVALKVYHLWLNYLAVLIVNIQTIFKVDLFVLSGGVMKSKRIFLDDLTALTISYNSKFNLSTIVLADAASDQDAGLMGATTVALAK